MWRAFVGSRLAMMAAVAGGKDTAAAVGKGTVAAVGKKASGAAPLSDKKRNSGILKVLPVSPSMRKFLGVPEASRTDALKKVWQYIKDNNLQDPVNKKEIKCDEKLKTIFEGKDSVGFLEIARLLNRHFVKAS